MKIKVYLIFYDDELDKIFLFKKRALDYKEYLEIYTFDTNVSIDIRKGYIYV